MRDRLRPRGPSAADTLTRRNYAEHSLTAHRDGPDYDFRRAMILAERQDARALGQFLRARFFDMPTQGRRMGSFWIDAGMLSQARGLARSP
jgi:hypothetical protein